MGISKNSREHKEMISSLPQDERVIKEYERLTDLYKKLPQNHAKLAQKLMARAAFMAVTLGELEVKISAEGVTSEYKNGENQWGTKKSPEVEVYNAMIKNYASVVKQMCDMLPEEEGGQTNDGFEKFVGDR